MKPIALILLPLALAWPASASESRLPPIESVRMLREARIAQMSGNPDLALQTLEQAAKEYPDQITPIVALLDHHRNYGATEGEVARLRAILTERLANPESPVPPGTLFYLAYNPDAEPEELRLVLRSVDALLGAEPNDYELLETRSVLQERLELVDESRATYARMLLINDLPSTHLRCLRLDRLDDRWTDVAGHLENLSSGDLGPVFRMSYIEALGKLGRYEDVVGQLDLIGGEVASEEVLYLNSLKELLAEVGWSFHDRGETEKAENMFRRILEIDPDHHDARRTVLYLYSDEEERLAHQADLDQRWSEETDADALLNEGATKLSAGDAAGAIALLERAAVALPDSEVAHFNLGLAANRLERWDEAERAFGRATELNPARTESRLNHGIALYQLNRWDEAIEVLLQALEAQPDLAQCHYYLYMCYRELRDTAGAAKHRALYVTATGSGD